MGNTFVRITPKLTCLGCFWFRPMDGVRGECRRPALRSGETYREIRSDDPGCGEHKKGRWNRG